MVLLTLRSSGFHGSPYAKELRVPWLPYAKELRVPWLSMEPYLSFMSFFNISEAKDPFHVEI